MEKYKINYSDEAIADLEAIYNYIAFVQLEPANAVNLVNAIRTAIRSLDTFPSRHQQVEWSPWKEIEMRYLISKKHLIFYFVAETTHTVIISRIICCRRNIPAILTEEKPT